MVKEKHLTSDCACKFSRFSMGLEKKKKKGEREREKGKCQVSEMPLFIDVTGIFSLSNCYY